MVVIGAHVQRGRRQFPGGQPCQGVIPATFRPTGGIQHGVPGSHGVEQQTAARFQNGVKVRPTKKLVPGFGGGLHERQPVAHIGEHAIDVEHGIWAHAATIPERDDTNLTSMGIDYNSVKTTMPVQVPMVGTLNIEFLELDGTHALLRMADQPAYHNHIGGIHAGAMFTLAETASGAIVLAEFGDMFDTLVPLAVSATIRYMKVALGPLTAEAVMDAAVADVLAELDSGKRPEFNVDVAIRDESGTMTGAMTILWTLKLLKK